MLMLKKQRLGEMLRKRYFCRRLTLKQIQRDWDEFFVASVITVSKENL